MVRTLLLAAISAAAITPAFAHDHAPLRGRLVFGDHEKAVVRILDLDTAEVTHEFPLPRPNPVMATAEGGRIVVIKTGDEAGTVRFLDNGLIRESHGDHDDIEKKTPRLVDLALSGDRPAHVVSRNGHVAVFFDGHRPWEKPSAPKVEIMPIAALHKSGKPIVVTWKSPAPQHGIAVPLGVGDLLVSVPNPIYAKGEDRSASSRPNGFQILTMRGKPEAWPVKMRLDETATPDLSCRLFHGYAALSGTHLFACEENEGGVLALSGKGGKWQARRIAYADGRRISALKAKGGRYAIGNYGQKSPYDALVRVDPPAPRLAEADVFPVPGNQGVCQFDVSGDGRRVANLTADGMLRVYDVAPEWRQVAEFEAVPAFDCAFGAATPTPSLAVMGKLAFVTDPLSGRIREYDLSTLKQGLDVTVGGKPSTLAAAAE